MGLTAAAGGFVVFLLSVPVGQGQNGWGVTYSSEDICASRGSTVNISCTFKHRSSVTIIKTCWHTKEHFDVICNSDYYREAYICNDKNCTLRIVDLKDSDATTYKFRLIGEQTMDRWTGEPGVTLTVTALQMHVTRVKVNISHTEAELSCNSTCSPPSYVWFKNGLKVPEEAAFYTGHLEPGDGISCALKGHEDHRVPSLYAPKFPSVSVSPSAEIVEGSSVTLTCSSDANPAAKYTWYKENQTLLQGPVGVYRFTSISSEDRGIYYCKSENKHGWINSSDQFIDVQYAPKLPSVSVSPSAEIVEGSSVTLTCSSDANPAAKYAWYKKDEDSPKASGQIFIITDFRAEHSGSYYCEAQNNRGRHRSTLHLAVLSEGWILIAAGTVSAFIILFILVSVSLWIRNTRAPKEPPEPVKKPDDSTQKQPAEKKDGLHYASINFSKKRADPLHSNITPSLAPRHKKEENVDTVEYATVKFNSGNTLPGNSQETGEDPDALYSTVNKTSNKHEDQNL
ncbi:B-cell receptor CD22-like [Anarrhichthys ocellatus]|uniref:B-cell receptor CD22-like n=1 Tax=Anarrhichthys ocellatus TaxID=433405 RepID=UPI0012ED76A5|nr:B-cell receptor CD22-like [Anarrhichthys ocellatus]